MLIVNLSPGEGVRIGDNVILTLEKKTGQIARLVIDADKSIPIRRIQAGETQSPRQKTVGITGKQM